MRVPLPLALAVLVLLALPAAAPSAQGLAASPGVELAAPTADVHPAVAPTRGPGYSAAGDWEGGLSYNGKRFSDAYARYFLTDRLAAQVGFEFERETNNSAIIDTSDTSTDFSIQAGVLYDICGGSRYRGYVLPLVGYNTRSFDDGFKDSGFSAGLTVGGDVKLSDLFSVGISSGLKFMTFSESFDGDDLSDGSKWWVGNYNRLSVTPRFPRAE
jgi:hypothetical protein